MLLGEGGGAAGQTEAQCAHQRFKRVLEECLQQNMPEVLNAVAAPAGPTDAAGRAQQRLQVRTWADRGQQMVQENTQEEGAPANHDAALAMQEKSRRMGGMAGTQDRQAGRQAAETAAVGREGFSRSSMAGSSSRNRGMMPIVLQARRPAA